MEAEEFLAHYGVKGMRWGQRREARYQKAHAAETAQLKDFAAKTSAKSPYKSMSNGELRTARAGLQGKLDKMNMETALSGLGLVAPPPSKVSKQALKRKEKTPFQMLSASEKDSVNLGINSSARNKAVAKTLIRGGVETAAVLGGARLLLKASNLSPENVALGTRKINTLVGGTMGLMVVAQLHSISVGSRYNKYSGQRAQIDRQLKENQRK